MQDVARGVVDVEQHRVEAAARAPRCRSRCRRPPPRRSRPARSGSAGPRRAPPRTAAARAGASRSRPRSPPPRAASAPGGRPAPRRRCSPARDRRPPRRAESPATSARPSRASSISATGKRLDIRYSSSSLTSYTSTWSAGSRRRRRLIAPIGVSRQASSSKRAPTGASSSPCRDVPGDRFGSVRLARRRRRAASARVDSADIAGQRQSMGHRRSELSAETRGRDSCRRGRTSCTPTSSASNGPSPPWSCGRPTPRSRRFGGWPAPAWPASWSRRSGSVVSPSTACSPAAARGGATPGAVIVEKESGARFVYREQKLHPVLNYASALLIVGADRSKTVLVSRRTIDGVPRGLPLGIADAPDSLPASGPAGRHGVDGLLDGPGRRGRRGAPLRAADRHRARRRSAAGRRRAAAAPPRRRAAPGLAPAPLPAA